MNRVKQDVTSLKLRVQQAIAKLQDIGAEKSGKYYFCLKFPEYKPRNYSDTVKLNRLENLWYGRSTDADFTMKLEAFVEYKRVEFE